MAERGYVHVYTGDGKGKTTAALGLAIRAALAGRRVFIGQFMKGMDYAELGIADLTFPKGGIDIAQYGTPRLICQGESASDEDVEKARAGLADIREKLTSGGYRIVVADEICVTLNFGLLSAKDLVELIELRPDPVELVLTGRGAPDEVIEKADLVTDMREVKHYYATHGIKARKGIEF